MQQISIAYPLRAYYDLDSLVLHDNARELIKHLLSKPQLVAVIGQKKSGKSHLLQAITNQFIRQNQSAIHINCALLKSAMLLSDFKSTDFIALDNIDAWISNEALEQQLWQIIKLALDKGKHIWFSHAGHLELMTNLKVRRSLASCAALKLTPPTTKQEITKGLIKHAESLGLTITQHTAHYLITHYSHDLQVLVGYLIYLENEARARNQPISIPLIKTTLPHFTTPQSLQNSRAS